MAFVLLNEAIKKYEIYGIALCFVGICVLSLVSLTNESAAVSTESTMTFGMLCMLVAASGYSMVIIWTRRMKEIKPIIILLVHGLFGVTCAITIMLLLKLFAGRQVSLLTTPSMVLLKLMFAGSLDTLCNLCFTMAF